MAETFAQKRRLQQLESNATSNQNSEHNSPQEAKKPKSLQLSFNEERILRLKNKKIGELLDMEAEDNYQNDLFWWRESMKEKRGKSRFQEPVPELN